MSWAIPSLPNTPSWHGAQLKHRDNFTFTLLLDSQEGICYTQLVYLFIYELDEVESLGTGAWNGAIVPSCDDDDDDDDDDNDRCVCKKLSMDILMLCI
jgi:hypothetical protein